MPLGNPTETTQPNRSSRCIDLSQSRLFARMPWVSDYGRKGRWVKPATRNKEQYRALSCAAEERNRHEQYHLSRWTGRGGSRSAVVLRLRLKEQDDPVAAAGS